MSTAAPLRADASSATATVELLEVIGDAFNRHDVDAIVDLFAEDGEFLNATGPEIFGTRHAGKAELREFFSGLMARCPDIRWEPIDNRVSGDKGFIDASAAEMV
jgi:ketosteroid isomerase-like protein